MEEILHQLIGIFPHYLQGFIHPRRCKISFINSKELPRGFDQHILIGETFRNSNTYTPED